MRVLVGCEFSGVVRDAFARRGHTAVSCDYGPSESAGGKHVVGDVRELLDDGWDMLIVFPDCTYLTVANNKSMQRGCSKYTAQQGQALRTEAIDLFMRLAECAIPKTAIENPIGIMSTRYRKPDQIVQPWQFGEDASKATCLWLKGLPLLRPTNVLPGGKAARRANQTPGGQNKLGPSPTRARDRSRTYKGIAEAMAEQWGE